jgi:hypothetical protein
VWVTMIFALPLNHLGEAILTHRFGVVIDSHARVEVLSTSLANCHSSLPLEKVCRIQTALPESPPRIASLFDSNR